MNGIPYVLPESMQLTRSEIPIVNYTFVNVEWLSAWITVIRVNIRMIMTMKRRRSRMMRLMMSLSSSSSS